MRHCNVCGRPLRTGVKYCFVCRSIQKAGGKRKDNFSAWVTALSGTLIGIIFLFSEDYFAKIIGYIGLFIGAPLLIFLILNYLSGRKKSQRN